MTLRSPPPPRTTGGKLVFDIPEPFVVTCDTCGESDRTFDDPLELRIISSRGVQLGHGEMVDYAFVEAGHTYDSEALHFCKSCWEWQDRQGVNRWPNPKANELWWSRARPRLLCRTLDVNEEHVEVEILYHYNQTGAGVSRPIRKSYFPYHFNAIWGSPASLLGREEDLCRGRKWVLIEDMSYSTILASTGEIEGEEIHIPTEPFIYPPEPSPKDGVRFGKDRQNWFKAQDLLERFFPVDHTIPRRPWWERLGV